MINFLILLSMHFPLAQAATVEKAEEICKMISAIGPLSWHSPSSS